MCPWCAYDIVCTSNRPLWTITFLCVTFHKFKSILICKYVLKDVYLCLHGNSLQRAPSMVVQNIFITHITLQSLSKVCDSVSTSSVGFHYLQILTDFLKNLYSLLFPICTHIYSFSNEIQMLEFSFFSKISLINLKIYQSGIV